MKAWKVIGIILLALVVLAGVGVGAYVWGSSQNNQTTNSNNASNNDETSNSNNNSSNVIPPKVITDATCNADELALSLGEGNGAAAGTRSLSLVFTNEGNRECTLVGFPGVSLVNANGNQIGSPAERASSANKPTVTLKPGGTTSSLVTYPVEANFDQGVCKDGATKLRVYPPNDVGYLSVASPITGWCPGFQVYPVGVQQ